MDSSGDALKTEYRLRFSRNEAYRNRLWRILCDEFFSAFVSPGMTVLDLGCGWGEFINHIRASQKYAMDLNPDAGRRLSGEIRFLNQDCSREWPLPSESLDVVFTSNFLEHLPDKKHIALAISEAHRCLKSDGVILCLGPNIKYIPGAYWDFWDHLVPLTEQSISELLRLRGFEIRRQVPRFLPYSMSQGRNPPLFMARWYLKAPVLWPWFGKQFLVVGHKSAKAKAPEAVETP